MRQLVKAICNGKHARLRRDLYTREPGRITAPVGLLVMGGSDSRRAG
jgi:hypothetical protein